jgi:hypothetical protein
MSAPNQTVEGFDTHPTPADRHRGNARFAHAQKAVQKTRMGQPWPSLARLERARRLHRRAGIRLLRKLDERGILDPRPRDIAAGKAGAT